MGGDIHSEPELLLSSQYIVLVVNIDCRAFVLPQNVKCGQFFFNLRVNAADSGLNLHIAHWFRSNTEKRDL